MSERSDSCGNSATTGRKWRPARGDKDKPSFDLPPAPHPTIHCFKNDPWAEHPLLRYNAIKEKKRQDNEVVIRRGKKVKNIVADVVYKKEIEAGKEKEGAAGGSGGDLEAFLTQEDFAEYRRDSVKAAPVVPMQKSWLRRIASLIPRPYKKKHLQLFRALAREVEERYELVLHETILNFVLIPPAGYVDPYVLVDKFPLFSASPPPWWDTYRINRHIIAQQLRILYPIVSRTFLKMRDLMNTHKLFYPDKIKIRGSNYMRPIELRDIILNQIRSNGDMFLQKFIPQLVRIFQNANALKSVNKSKQELIMECASHMIVSDGTAWAMNTIQEIVSTYENYEKNLPRILVDTAIDDARVTFAPPVEGWMYCFKKMIDEIVSVVQNIPDAAELFWSRGDEEKSIKVFCRIVIPNFFVELMTERFHAVMAEWLSDVQNVADRIYDQYKILLDGSGRTRLQAFVTSKENNFYAGFKESAFLKQLSQSMYTIPKNEFVGWLQVNNEDVIGRLLDGCKSHQNIISEHLTKWLRAHHHAIITGYKEIRDRLLRKPATTAELMELVEYIDEARGVLLLLLKEDIVEGLKMVLAFMDYYILSADDMELAVTAHKLLRKIQPAFEKSAIMIEDQKLVFEEQLYQKIEEMKGDLKKLLRRVKEDFGRYGDYAEVPNYCDDLRYVRRRVDELQEGIDWINTEETLFKLNQSQFADIDEINLHLEPYTRLFKTTRQWQRAERKYMDGDFDLDAEKIDVETEGYYAELIDLQALFKSRIKAQKELEAKEKHIPISLLYDEDNLQEIPPPLKICNLALEKLKEFRANLPVMRILCNPAMRLRHWVQMSEYSGLEMIPDTGSSLRKILKMDLDPYMEEFAEISFCATQELLLATTVEEMKEAWLVEKIEYLPYKETETNILHEADDIQFLLNRHIVDTRILKGSRFVVPHRDLVHDWEATLVRAQNTMDEWLKVQKRWIYLEHMFSSDDIQVLLPDEGQLFMLVDETWRNLMLDLESQVNALEMAKKLGRWEQLLQCTAYLEKVIFGLNIYLDEKRVFFPRFFFLTNEEMVLILAETKDANKVQPFLNKVFEGISELRIDSEMLAFGMLSAEGERVTFSNPVDTGGVKGCVEKWFSQVEETMVSSLRNITTYAKDAFMHTSRSEWVLKWPGQVVLCVSQIYWTYEVHKAFIRSTAGIQTYLAKWVTHLDNTIDVIRGELPKLARVILGALVTVDVHARDVLEELIANKVQTETDYLWIAQLRYYFEDFQVVLRMLNSNVNYGYEYVGNPSRLVITPLTDRCYRVLIGAYHLNLNGALVGPASTGKSETAKDLTKTIAKQCVVLNCSYDLSVATIGRFIRGLASSGAWLCFDDFNRMDPEVLSVIAQQLWTVQQAVASKMPTCILEGLELPVNLECNAIITMNPGYTGRSELPENMKVLFRPVAMMVPDFRLIGEIHLFALGFANGKILAGKMVTLCHLFFEQLSSQQHYDYGMRAMKAILVATGHARNKNPDMDEDKLILKAIESINLPKFLPYDVPLCEGLISDLFRGVKIVQTELDPLIATLKTVCESRNLQPTDYFIEKTLQIYEMILARHGVILVGDPMGGKTCAYQCLAAALTEIKENKTPGFIGKRVQYKIVNPKSITMHQLHGFFEGDLLEWSDGVVPNIFREMASSTNDDRKWIVFDGPVDSLWVENMNTVLDNHKRLCLISGEIIRMTPLMTLLFEAADLEQASPSTVSRCGMIYMESKQLGWRTLKDSYIQSLPETVSEEQKEILEEFLEWLVPACFVFLRRPETQTFIGTSQLHQFQNFVRLFRTCLKEDSTEDEGNIWLQCSFVFCIVWSFGATLVQKSKEQFDSYLRSVLVGNNKDFPRAKSFKLTKNQMPPEKGSLFDYICDKKNNTWVVWMETVDKAMLRIPENAKVNELIIPTDETARQMYFLKAYLNNDIPLMFVGPTGTGKSAIAQNYMMSLPKEKYIPNIINFSARTSANLTQNIIMSKLDRRKKRLFGPIRGKKCVVFVDDLNMPQPDMYGAQPPLELIRQWLDHGSWYDKKNTAISLIDMLFVCAMGPPGGGRNDITPRLVRHMSILAIDSFDDNTLKKIFTSIVDWHFAKEFDSSVVRWARPMITATMQIYKSAMSLFLPTPAKSHYLFNLRDFSRVIRGVLLVPATHLKEPPKVMKLWVHEVYRVFYDRLVDEKDRTTFFKLTSSTVEENFKQDMQKLFGHLVPEGKKVEDVDLRGLIFGDFMDSQADKIYDEIVDLTQLRNYLESRLTEYNSVTRRQMTIIFFQFAIEHISRISRILKQDNGHALLVGVGGCGRQSWTKMAAFLAGFDLIQIELSRNYGTNEWREDLKRVLKHAGNDGKPTVFLVADTQIKDESYMEDINMILNTGDIPDLFEPDEIGEIYGVMQRTARAIGRRIDNSPLPLFNFFIERVRTNLHVVLAMSPVGDVFKERLRMFPSLINCCTIDMFTEWPDEALEKVAQRFLANLDTEEDIRIACVSMCQYFHQSVRKLAKEFYNHLHRKSYVTPTSYMELMFTFKHLIVKKRAEIEAARQRYLNGLERLAFAAEQVAVMRAELEVLQQKILETAAATEQLMIKIAEETAEVEKIKEVVAAEEVIANAAAAVAEAIKQDCEIDLAEAIPALDAARAALDTLTTPDIAIVRSMKNPPYTVKLVLEAVCIMRGIKPEKKVDANGRPYDDFWAASLRMLSNMKFLDALKEYDKDNIPIPVMKKIREKFLPAKEFVPEKIKYVSTACEGLCKWIKAMEVYDRVTKYVAPKKAKLAQAESELQILMDKLNEKRAQLRLLAEKLQELNDEYMAMKRMMEELEEHIRQCLANLERAQKLIDGLSGEKSRWEQGVAMLNIRLHNLVGDILIASAVVAYLGPFGVDYRQGCIENWLHLCTSAKIPCAEPFSLIATLGEPDEIREWHLAGLPIDIYSIDNGIIMFNARRWPLIIDPQAIASKWIRRLEAPNGLRVIKLTDADYIQVVEDSIQEGIPVLLDNVGEEIDPAFEPILLKETFKQEGILCMQIGEKVIECDVNFRFYVITRLRNPHYLPETAVKVTLVNFIVTPIALQDQLLGVVAAKEDPVLEEQRVQLELDGVNNKLMMKEIEDKILHLLISFEGNIVDDEAAIQMLLDSKDISEEIIAKQKAATLTRKKIEELRNRFRPIAIHGSTLFFSISELANIDPMYQYSFTWFVNLYSASISNSKPSRDLATRTNYINEHFTASIYRNVSRSLFEKDRLAFCFVFCVALMKEKGDFDMETWRFLLMGESSSGDKHHHSHSTHPNPAPDWLAAKSWDMIVKLSEMKPFAKLSNHVTKHVNHWKKLYDHADPQTVKFPAPFDKMSDIQRLVILRCFRPDKLIPAVQIFIGRNIGREFIEPPNYDFETIYNDSNAATPLVFVLSPGADPTLGLFKFASDKGFPYPNKLQSICLGQGQGPIARKVVEQCALEGNWVLLQNCHLATKWMPVLETICEDVITTEETHPAFRLWLTSYPSPHFPVTILQNSVKMTNEPPQELRANLLRTYTSIPLNDPKFFASVPTNTRAWHRMLFGLCFFHAVVQGRRKFGPLGWNELNEFSESDLRISLMQLHLFLIEYPVIPFDILSFLTAECNYGGRVTDDKDMRLLSSLFSIFYNKDVVDKDNYPLSSSGIYYVPGEADYSTCFQYIRPLPLNSNPQVFGLHENANITRGNRETVQLLESALLTQIELKPGSGEDSASNSKVFDISQDILTKLPVDYDMDVVSKKFPVVYMNSMNTVLRQELVRFNKLINVVRESLQNLQRAIKGQIVMSPGLEDVFKAVLKGKVPSAWATKSYPSEKRLGSYVTDLIERLTFFQQWVNTGPPVVFWLSGFFFTQSFLTGVLQNYARKYKTPIDLLGFEYDVTPHEKSVEAVPKYGAYVRGLFLEAGRWDRQIRQLVESHPKILYDSLPVIWLRPGQKTKFVPRPCYECPLYRTSARHGTLSTTGHSSNFLLYIRLLSNLPQQHWINRGTAALCQLDE